MGLKEQPGRPVFRGFAAFAAKAELPGNRVYKPISLRFPKSFQVCPPRRWWDICHCHNQVCPEHTIAFRYAFRIPVAGGKAIPERLLTWTITPVHIAQKEPKVKKVIRILIASLLLAGSLSVYSLADGPSPTPCSPTTRVCG